MEAFDADTVTRAKIISSISSPNGWLTKRKYFLCVGNPIFFNKMQMKPLAPYACKRLGLVQGERKYAFTFSGVRKEVTEDNLVPQGYRNARNMEMFLKKIFFPKKDQAFIEQNGKIIRLHFSNSNASRLWVKHLTTTRNIDPKSPIRQCRWAWMRESQIKSIGSS